MTFSRSGDFFQELKRGTEANWKAKSINPTGYGFQFQPGTRWNPGLSEDEIAEYEGVLGIEFPHDLKAFLRAMNGTDLPTVNIYGSCGEPERQSVGVYRYPRDIELVQQRMADVRKVRTQVVADLAEQGFGLPDDAGLVPIYIHRYVMCTPDLGSSVVLSIFTDLARQTPEGEYEPSEDAIVYGNSLKEYLEKEFLTNGDKGS